MIASTAMLLWAVCRASPAEESATSPSVQNEFLRLVFDRTDGHLREFTDLSNGHNHVDAASPLELWRIELPAGATPPAITPRMAQSFSWTNGATGGQAIRLVWQAFHLKQSPDLRVTADISLAPREPAAEWRIRAEGLLGLTPRVVSFPRVGTIARQENEVLAVPVWMGERTCRARELLNGPGGRGQRMAWEYPGLLSLQCLAFYGENGPGLSVSVNDTGALRKHLAVFGDGDNGLSIEVAHVLPTGEGTAADFSPPYEVRVGAFTGDWFTAAQRYRDWAQHQRWVKESRVKRGLVPRWVLDTALWVWNRGRSEGVLEPAAFLKERAGVPVSVFWHWWHGCAYDVGFPEYLPPREGEEPFRKALEVAHERSLHAIVYMNQRLWGMTTRSWTDQDAARYAVKGADGTIAPEIYNTFTKAPCASMCMGTAFWRNTYAGLAETAIRGLGVDGIYMDQACSSLACYDPTHGHALGGGAYWMEGFRLLEADIRRRCAGVRPIALAGEGCGEAWLPHLDLMLSLQVSMERYASPGAWEPIPFFHAVYHDCALLYGNYSSLTYPPYDELWPAPFAPAKPLELLDRAFSQQFRLEQGRAFVWGQQPTIANFRAAHLESRAEELGFVMRLARLRARAAKYLRDGVLLRPPAIPVPEDEISMSRLSIYAGQQDAVRVFRRTAPRLLAGAWQAADGDVAVVVVNIADVPVTVTVRPARPEYPLAEAGAIRCMTENETADAGRWQKGAADLEITLSPGEARVYELSGR
jgi:hypothetical protein